MNMIEQLEAEEVARVTSGKEIPDFSPGDTLSVNVRIREGDRERVQRFEGVCIARAGKGVNENFTVRKISFGEGVERVFPVVSPMIESIEVKRKGRVRRAKLYYLRNLRGKIIQAAKRRENTLRRQFQRARAQTFPDGTPQERSVGAVYFLNRYGDAFVERLLADLPLDPGQHWLLSV